jgi:hypothetical protein
MEYQNAAIMPPPGLVHNLKRDPAQSEAVQRRVKTVPDLPKVNGNRRVEFLAAAVPK